MHKSERSPSTLTFINGGQGTLAHMFLLSPVEWSQAKDALQREASGSPSSHWNEMSFNPAS